MYILYKRGPLSDSWRKSVSVWNLLNRGINHIQTLLQDYPLGPHLDSFFLALWCHCKLFPVTSTWSFSGRALKQILLLNIHYVGISINTVKRYVNRNPLHLTLIRFKLTTTNPLLLMSINEEAKRNQYIILWSQKILKTSCPILYTRK